MSETLLVEIPESFPENPETLHPGSYARDKVLGAQPSGSKQFSTESWVAFYESSRKIASA